MFALPRRLGFPLALLFTLAAIFYARAWRSAPIIDGDSPQYLEVAQDLRDLRLDALHDRTPGYPLLLLMTGSTTRPSRALFFTSLVLHFLAAWVLAASLNAVAVDGRLVLLFGAALTLPPFVEPAAYVMTENLTASALAVGVAGLVAWFRCGSRAALSLAALAFAYAALTRPVYQAITPVVAGTLACALHSRDAQPRGPRTAKAGVALIAGSALVLGALSFVNLQRFGYFGLVPTLGLHLSTKTMAFVERLPDEFAVAREILVAERDVQLTQRGGTHTATQTVWSARSRLAAATGFDQPELSAYLLRMNLVLIARAPVEYLQEVARSLVVYWFPAFGPLAAMGSRVLRWSWAAVHVVFVGVLVVQAIVLAGRAAFRSTLWLAGAPVRSIVVPLAVTTVQIVAYTIPFVIVVYTMLLSCFLDIGEPRQRRPTDILIVYLCVIGIDVWRRRVRAEIPRRSSVGARA